MNWATLDPYAGAKSMEELLARAANTRQTNIQNQYLPQNLEQQLLQAQLGNQKSQAESPYWGPQAQANLGVTQAQVPYLNAQTGLMGQQSKYYGQEANARMGLQNAQAQQIDYYMKHPGMLAGGNMGQLDALLQMMKTNPGMLGGNNQQPGQQPQSGSFSSMPNAAGNGAPNSPPSNLSNDIQSSLLAQFKAPVANLNRTQQLTEGASYLNAPKSEQNYMTAQARAFGIDPSEAISKYFLKGKGLADIAQEKGFGNNPALWPEASYSATTASLTNAQKRQSAVSELASVDDFINRATGPYAQRIGGWSPSQVIDQAKTLYGSSQNPADKRKMAEFVAATMITPDLNIIRARAMGMNTIGIESLNKIAQTSHNQWKISQALLDPEVYQMANQIANHHIQNMAKAANRPIFSPNRGQGNNEVQGNFQTQNNQKQNQAANKPDPLGIR